MSQVNSDTFNLEDYHAISNVITRNFIPLVAPYYARNDAAHQIEHALQVRDNAIKYIVMLGNKGLLPTKYTGSERYSLLRMVIVAALCHDMFSLEDRLNHQMCAVDWLRQTKPRLLSETSPHDIALIEAAICEHRSSFTGKYTSIVSEIVAAADTGELDCDKFIHRSYLYAISALDKSSDDALVHAMEHIGEKFGGNGVRVPEWYHLIAGEGYAKQKALVDELAASKFDITSAISWLQSKVGSYGMTLTAYNANK